MLGQKTAIATLNTHETPAGNTYYLDLHDQSLDVQAKSAKLLYQVCRDERALKSFESLDEALAFFNEKAKGIKTGSHYRLSTGDGYLPATAHYGPNGEYGLEEAKAHLKHIRSKWHGEYTEYWRNKPLTIEKVTTTVEPVFKDEPKLPFTCTKDEALINTAFQSLHEFEDFVKVKMQAGRPYRLPKGFDYDQLKLVTLPGPFFTFALAIGTSYFYETQHNRLKSWKTEEGAANALYKKLEPGVRRFIEQQKETV